MPPELLIIADDLTGANDTGVQFARQGISVIVSLHHEQNLADFAEDCQVLVVNTESRHINPDEAFERVYSVAQQGVQLGVRQFYKKTDSTLRGNIGSELAALLAATGAQQLFFAPAYPKLNRTTRQGIQYVDNIPLSQSSFALDSFNPSHEAAIATIIAQQTNLAVQPFVTLPTAAPAPTIFVVDAATDNDLRRAAELLHAQKLLAGAAGWAEFLAEVKKAEPAPSPIKTVSAPMLIVNGSRHENSLRQVQHAAQNGIPVIECFTEDAARQVNAAFAISPRVILTTRTTPYDEQAAENLARIVNDVLNQTNIETLVVFGGDTLAAIAAARGWQAFRPQTEILAGVPLVKICGQKELLLLTKAGGFGAEDLITKRIDDWVLS